MKKALIILTAALLLLTGCGQTGGGGGGQHVTPGYTREEPGHWELTDILTREDGGIVVSEETKQSMVFIFSSGAEFTVDAYWFENSYYQSDTLLPGFNITRTGEPDGDEDVYCTLVFSDDKLGENVLGYFRDDANGGADIERFSVDENMSESTGYDGNKFYMTPHGSFPESEDRQDGDTVYIVLNAYDGQRSASVVWEYKWVAQPETIEVPEQYGPIEYF